VKKRKKANSEPSKQQGEKKERACMLCLCHSRSV
jgi:hypothetical protein